MIVNLLKFIKMKTKSIFTGLMIALVGISSVFAQSKTEKFKVLGNCEMCEKRIESAAKGFDGVKSADWDKTTKEITVEFDQSKTSLDAIHKAIAKAGHDTDRVKAEDKVYNDLPSCCHYNREMATKQDHSGHSH